MLEWLLHHFRRDVLSETLDLFIRHFYPSVLLEYFFEFLIIKILDVISEVFELTLFLRNLVTQNMLGVTMFLTSS